MGYKLIISDNADSQLERIIAYIAVRLHDPDAAGSIFDEINAAYEELEKFPEARPLCNDIYLSERGYRKYVLSHHDYVILYRISGEYVKISGIFHTRENYVRKL